MRLLLCMAILCMACAAPAQADLYADINGKEYACAFEDAQYVALFQGLNNKEKNGVCTVTKITWEDGAWVSRAFSYPYRIIGDVLEMAGRDWVFSAHGGLYEIHPQSPEYAEVKDDVD